jgi:hypothetical protein
MTQYNANDLIHYRATLALIKHLVEEGVLTEREYRMICSSMDAAAVAPKRRTDAPQQSATGGILNKKYGFPSGSIFKEVLRTDVRFRRQRVGDFAAQKQQTKAEKA